MYDDIGAVIITYNPQISKIKANIAAIEHQVRYVIIVDNGSRNVYKIRALTDSKVYLIELSKNYGIGYAQNIGISNLKRKNIKWAITLDQDSVAPEDMVKKYVSCDKFTLPDTGILAAQYYDINWSDVQRKSILLNSLKVSLEDRVISSGNLVRISAWEEVYGFDEWMFIDLVDFDFDAKLKLKGYKIWQVNNILMKHEVGKVVHHKFLEKLLLFRKNSVFSDHSAFREFYINRNTIVYAKRYPNSGSFKHQIIISFLQSIRVFPLYEGSKIKKLIASWKGIIAGIKYRPSKDISFRKFMETVEDYEGGR